MKPALKYLVLAVLLAITAGFFWLRNSSSVGEVPIGATGGRAASEETGEAEPMAVPKEGSSPAAHEVGLTAEPVQERLPSRRVVGELSPEAIVIASRWAEEEEEAHRSFQRWLEEWHGAGRPAKSLPQGLRTARVRLHWLQATMPKDPDRALSAAVPMKLRQSLPAELEVLLEKRVDTVGSIARRVVLPERGGSDPEEYDRMEAHIGRDAYRLHSSSTARNRSRGKAYLHGIAIGEDMAVTGSPIRSIELGERFTKPVIEICPVSGEATPLPPEPVLVTEEVVGRMVDAGDEVISTCVPEHVSEVEKRLLAREVAASPWIAAAGAAGDNGSGLLAEAPAQSWTLGEKKVLIIRVDFSDLEGEVMTENAISDVMNGTSGVKAFFEQNSYGTTSTVLRPAVAGDSPDVTPVLRLPQTASYYATGYLNHTLHADARTAATAAGFAVSSYDRIGVVFKRMNSIPGSRITYGGVAFVETEYFAINGSSNFDLRVVAHEIGHNYGLPHASRQRVAAGSSAVADTGSWEEYGDSLDVMGGAGGMSGHFNMWAKSYLHWIKPAGVQEVTEGGVYRVHRFDHVDANPNNAAAPLAIRIQREGDQSYWVGHRRAFTSNANASNGAYLLWAYGYYKNPRVIDTLTPSDFNAADAPVPIGSTFTDEVAGIQFAPLARGGTGSGEWLDVRITFIPRLVAGGGTTYLDETVSPGRIPAYPQRLSENSASISWNTVAGTAQAGQDFTSSSGSFSWQAWERLPRLMNVPVLADAVEDDGEEFTIEVTSPVGLSTQTYPHKVQIRHPGHFDPGFDMDLQSNSTVNAMVRDDSGRFVIANHRFIRVSAKGGSDPTFQPPVFTTSGFNALALQSDGKILLGGSFTVSGGPSRLARFHPDGALDTSFNTGTGPDASVYAVEVQTDGKILVAGDFANFNGTARKQIVRLNTNGSIDSSYASPGFTNSWSGSIRDIALQSDGKAIVCGSFSASSTSPFRFSVARINTNGTLDTSFNVGFGAHSTSSTSTANWVNSVAVLPNGKVAVGGTFGRFNNIAKQRFAVLSSTGAVDTSYTLAGLDNTVEALLPLPGNKLVAAGYFTGTTDASPVALSRIAMFNSNGTLDTAFNNRVVTNNYLKCLHHDTESGRIMAGGWWSYLRPEAGRYAFRIFSGMAGTGPVIKQQPSSATVNEGNAHTLSVSVSAAMPGLQWFQNGIPIPRANDVTYTIPAVNASHAGTYHAAVVNAHGSVTSSPATLTVITRPVITTPPADRTVAVNTATSFTVAASGPNLSYQWQRNSANISGATAATYNISSATTALAGTYRCVVTNTAGSATSATAELVVVTPPSVTGHPSALTRNSGQSASFTVTATGLLLSYQWQKDNVDMPGRTSPTLDLTALTTADMATYRCRVSNIAAAVNSNGAFLTVIGPPTITSHPSSTSVVQGQNASFMVSASGLSLSYQWQFNEENLQGANSATLPLTGITLARAGRYRCVVTNPSGSATSNNANLVVVTPPVLTSPLTPSNHTLAEGRTADFQVIASGLQLTYQWRRDGQAVAGLNQSVMNKLLVGSDTGAWTCVVSNIAGTVTSPAFHLDVVTRPVINANPESREVSLGSSQTLFITATGKYLSYQWYRDRSPLAGATAAQLVLSSFNEMMQGRYECVVSNLAGSVTSEPGHLWLIGRPVITRHPFPVRAEVGAPVILDVETAGSVSKHLWKRGTVPVSGLPTLNIQAMSGALVGSYTVDVQGDAAMVISEPAKVSAVSGLQSALDHTKLKWSTSGHAFWSRVTGPATHDGKDALTSGVLSPGQTARLHTRITGPARLQWWQKLSTDSVVDRLAVSVNDLMIQFNSGERDWEQQIVDLPAGEHLVEFAYTRGLVGGGLQNQVWLDEVTTTPTYQILVGPQAGLVQLGTSVSLSVVVDGVPPSYQWYKNKRVIPGATAPQLNLQQVSLSDGGDYSVKVGGVMSTSTRLIVVDLPPMHSGLADHYATFEVRSSHPLQLDATWSGPQGTILSQPVRATFSKRGLKLVWVPEEADFGSMTCTVTDSLTGGSLALSTTLERAGMTSIQLANDTVYARVGEAVGVDLHPEGVPTRFTTRNLPPGLVVNAAAMRIEGYPTKAGYYATWITPWNIYGAGLPSLLTFYISVFAPEYVGKYAGLVEADAVVNQEMGGMVEFTLSANGGVSGHLRHMGLRHPFTAVARQWGMNSPFFSCIVGRGSSKPALFLEVVVDPSLVNFTGRLHHGGASTGVAGQRLLSALHDPHLTFGRDKGTYNMLARPTLVQAADSTLPSGSAWARFAISSTGAISVSGRLAEGVSFTTSSACFADGSFTLHAVASSITSAQGLIILLPQPEGSLPTHLLSGTLVFNRLPASSTRSALYHRGFYLTRPVEGASWHGASAEPQASAHVLGFYRGGLTSTEEPLFQLGLELSATLKPKLQPASPATFVLDPRTGLFTGGIAWSQASKFVPGRIVQRKGKFSGVMLSRHVAGGVVVLPQESLSADAPETLTGEVSLKAAP